MFDQDLQTAQSEAENQKNTVHAATQELVNITEKLSKGMTLDIDLDNAKLSQVQDTQNALNQNIVTCIMGLDQISSKFGSQFTSMKEKTGFEKFVGIFSKTSSEEMRSERIKKADISENLQELITQSEEIITILKDSEKNLQREIEAGEANLTKTVNLRESTVSEHLAVNKKVESMIDEITMLENKIEQELDPEKRTSMETELVGLNASYNEILREEQVLLAQSQTLENYVKKNQMHMESLHKSLAAQQVLINKIRTDTDQRVVLYEQYQQTLKVSTEQQIAHQINEIGTETDHMIQEGMAQAGHAAQNQVIDMLEEHNEIMVKNQELQEKSAKATEKFLKRFSAQIEKHNAGQY